MDSETYLTDVYLTNEHDPDPWSGSLNMTFDIVQVPSTKLSIKWIDVNNQPLAKDKTPATNLKDILTFNFIENRKFDLPNQDKEDPYFRLINKVKRSEVKDIKGATALVDGKKNGEEVTLDGKIYKLTTSYNPAYNEGSKIQLMFMPDVIDRTKNPDAVTPDKYVRVTIDAGKGTKLAQGETKKVYDVRVGKALKAEQYPKLDILEGHKEPITWTIAPGTVINEKADIVGNAAKTAAQTITKENLKPVDTTALQGQDLTEAFWHKGVALADNVEESKKAEFEALLKDAKVTDLSNRTSEKVEDQIGKLLVTFKDGSTLEVENQKLIVKPNTVTVAFDKAAGKENPLRDGDTTVKGKITASSNSDKFPVSLDGAVVTIKKGDTVLTRTLANADGSFVAGVKDPLVAGEEISVVVTLPESKTESAPVTEKVQLNPDKLNEIIPTGNEVVKNLKGKKGVDQTKVATLEAAIKKAYDELVEKDGKIKTVVEEGKTKSKVEVSPKGQKSLDDQFEAIKKAIEELTGNSAPEVKGTTSHKEIFKFEALNLEDGITVTDADSTEQVSDIVQVENKDFTYKVEKIEKDTRTEITKDKHAEINQTAGTYEVTYTAKDKSGAEGTFVMTLVVKEPVVEIKDNFPEVIPDGYVKVEFKPGDHGTLEGTTKFLVKDGSAKNVLNAPKINPNANYEAKKDANWDPAIPETFTGTKENNKSFTFTAQYTYNGPDVVEQKPGDKKPDVPSNFVKVEFKKGDHGVISSEYTTIYWVNPEAGKTLKDITKPTVTALEGYKFTGWDKADTEAIGKGGLTVTAQYKEKVVTVEPKIDDPNKPGTKITDPDYAVLTFNKGDNGEFAENAKTTIWVLKNEEVKFNAPTVKANDGFVFSGWEPALQTKYTKDETHTAKYEPKSNISDVPVAGFQEVKFLAGTDGKFEGDKTEKSVWVRPGVEVDLTGKAPKVTVTNDKKGFVGWDKPLVGIFSLEKDESKQPKATVITAQYKDKVVTKDPNDKDYAEIKFDAGKNGTFEKQDEKTTFWVLKGQQVTDDFKAPTIKANDGYTFKAWDPEVKTSYDKDQTHTATYKTNNSISDDPVEGFQEVKFIPGTDGKFEGEKQEKSVWVEPGVLVDLRAKAPKVIANNGKVHTGWDKDLVAKFQLEFGEDNQPKATEIKAQYKDKVVTKDPEDKNYVTVEFLPGDHGTFEQVGDPKKDQTTKFWVLKGEEVTFNAPTVTANQGYSFTGWKEPIKTVYSENTTHTAQYSNTISDKYVEGWTEITFNSGDNGRFVADAKTVKWVDPKADVKLSDMAPGIKADINYSFKAWNNGSADVAENTVAKYTEATTFTATYESDLSDKQKDGFVKVTFAPGKEGKFISGKPTINVRKNKDVDLREKAPKVMPKTGYGHTGWDHDLAKVNVKEDTTITATYTKGEFDPKNITSFDILGPKKAAYEDDDKLDLTGFTVVAIDKSGIRKEYTVQDNKLKNGEEELTGVTLKVGETTIDLASLPKLNHKAHDDKPITLVKDNTPYNSTVHLTVNKAKTDQPTDLVAANQGENPTETKVKGKAQKGDTVKIYVPGQAEPIATVEVTNDDGTFETSVSKENKPYDVGTKFNVTATAVDKEESSPQEVKVIKDVNGDWKDDGEGQKTPTPTAKALNVGKEPKVTTITGKAEKGAKVVAKVGDTVVGTATADNNGDYKIEATKNGKTGEESNGALDKDTEVKVTAKLTGKLESDQAAAIVKIDKDDNGVDDDKEKTERPAALASNIGKAPKFTTITGEAEKGATVTAKVGTQVVGTATADSITGKYTIQAKQNNAPIQEGIKIDVTATLAPKTESLKQTVVVFNDTDGTGQPDSAKDFDVKKATGMQVVASPDKMVYSDGDKLNLDGLKVLLKDVNGNQKIFTYNSKNNKEFTDAGLSVDYKQNDKLTNDDNGKKLTVTLDTKGNNEVTKAITGETPTALTVNKNQSAQPVDVVAANQGDDKVTKVKGKATKGADIKITDADGNSLLPTGTTLKAGDDGVFETKLNNLLDPGTRVFVTATEPGKSESPKAETPVIRDKDGNWEADTGAKLSTPVIDPIREKDEKIVVAAPAAKDKIQTIEVSDQNGKTVTLTKDPADKTGKTWKVDGSNDTVKENNDGKLEIPVKDKLPLNDRDQIKVTFKDGENPANEAFDKAPVQKASQTPTVDPVYTGDKNVKIVDPTVADPTAKTIKVKVGENDTMVIEKQADNSWKVKNNPNAKVEVKDGKVVVPLEDKAKKDDVIKVSTINDSKVESPQAEVTVIDKEKSTTPTVNPVATNDTKITGKAGPNADVVITITPKDGGTPKEIVTKADKDGNFTVPADGLKDGDTIVAKATEKDKAPAESAPVTVGVDTTGLDKAIQDGKDALDPEKGGKNNGTPADKKLEEAIKEGEDLKKRDPAPTQKELDDAKDKIEKAIEEKKETDKALDELKKAKDELDKTIEDAEADEKPDEAIEKGQDASDTAGGVIKSKGKDADGKDMTSKQINDLVEKTKEENRLLRLPVIQVAITNAVNNGKSVVFTTNPGRCKAIITVIRKDLSIENYEAETGPGGTGSLTLKNPLKSGDSVKVKVTRITEERPIPDYLDNYTSKIV